jgi:hypothetical protein
MNKWVVIWSDVPDGLSRLRGPLFGSLVRWGKSTGLRQDRDGKLHHARDGKL